MNSNATSGGALLEKLQYGLFSFSNFLDQSGLLNVLILFSTIAMFALVIQGFRFLRRQEKDDQQQNLIFQLTQNIVRLRDRYRSLRNPLIRTSEYPRKYQNKSPASLQAQDEAQIYRYVFSKRWQQFSGEWDKMYDHILLSEIYWKPWCQKEVQDLQSIINELKYNIEQLIVFKKYELLRSPSADPVHLEHLNHLVFLQGEQDVYLKRFRKNTETVLKFLRNS
ncbi:hypothetical protein P0082_03475 [Candidatus Haliotispira prima]|uniref:DUF4760 domain-containing protein n=1 Tax=Candidatus Haliotispira prima TaxID=3034016 RepID=A0ABY8MIU2_9SPIO|nr:hypothetical protein P0082_03475 [Candidatus Haliotispira prima]